MNINRLQTVEKYFYPGRILIIYGPRRIGKTTMVNNFARKNKDKEVLSVLGDDFKLQNLLNSCVQKDITDWAKAYEIIIIDEAQYIKNIGQAMKMLIDTHPEKTIILTGSSSFDIAQKTGEPLTGRHFITTLLPLCMSEFLNSNYDKKQNLEDILIYGSYPEVLINEDKVQKIRILEELMNSYLLKDILILDKIKSSILLVDILKNLSFQTGNEVSFNEIAINVGSDVKTVQRYIDILEKTFVIKRVYGHSGNLRGKTNQKSKYYFYDLGIRNMLINNFNKIENRNDIGQLWENFVFMELYKKSKINEDRKEFFFWRNKKGLEVDILTVKDEEINAFECKWKNDKASFISFLKINTDAKTHVINKDNFFDFGI
jgi:predicted AAA+ superfamily ATPase